MSSERERNNGPQYGISVNCKIVFIFYYNIRSIAYNTKTKPRRFVLYDSVIEQ